jgi:AraC family transcriptional regulator
MHFDSLSPLIVEGLMMEIAGEGARQTYEKGYGVPTWMNKAVTLLKERSKESLTLAEIADFAGVHPIHLAQTFRKTQGLTVGQFLRRERLENARHDLLKTEKLLAEIAFDNGFADQSHFSRLFKQKFGTTPAVYRRNHKR